MRDYPLEIADDRPVSRREGGKERGEAAAAAGRDRTGPTKRSTG